MAITLTARGGGEAAGGRRGPSARSGGSGLRPGRTLVVAGLEMIFFKTSNLPLSSVGPEGETE
jgi:hypothetical protein